MLEKLTVQNYVIIEKVEINFSHRLTILTGETGAGKSILLDALQLILGSRANSNILFDPKQKCVIEGTFNIEKMKLKSFFEENDLDFENETIVRREITPSGKSRAFINDTPVKLSMLQLLGNQLINLHAQHQSLYLNDRTYQMMVLDLMAGHQKDVEKYQTDFQDYLSEINRLKSLKMILLKPKKNWII